MTPASVPPGDPEPSDQRFVGSSLLVIIGLLLATWLAYAPVLSADFVNYDDDVHVYENRFVATGLTDENIRWAFGIHGPSQWHPLAWISHQFDCELFGARPGDGSAHGHHLVNVLLHAGSVVATFLVFWRLAGSVAVGGLVALLFAIHPLNVESVAWISERRNTLAGLWFLISLWAWTDYVRRPGFVRYLLVLLSFALGLMAKPMLVTFPCVLLLLDYWPLRRWIHSPPAEEALSDDAGRHGLVWLVVEKVPMLALSAVSSVLTVKCQQAAGVVSSLETLPFLVRLLNTVEAYGLYLRQLIWPRGLCAFYPHPGFHSDDPLGELFPGASLSAVVLIAMTVVCLHFARTRPWLIVGWLWFGGMLVPMIGLVQVGEQQMADRYMYLAALGLFLAAACELRLASGRRAPTVMGVVGILLAGSLVGVTRQQANTWKNSLTLWEHALEVNPDNHYAYVNGGLAWMERGDIPKAEEYFRSAIRLVPDYALAHYNLGVVLHERGELPEAAAHFDAALREEPGHAAAWVRFGAIAAQVGQVTTARRAFEQAIEIDERNLHALINLGLLLEQSGNADRALDLYRRALEIDPGSKRASDGLSRVRRLQEAGRET